MRSRGAGGNESTRETEEANNTTTTNHNVPLTTAATSNPRRTRDQFEEDNPTLDIDPFEDKEPYEMTNEINDSLNVEASTAEVGGARVVSIDGHSWHAGQLKLGILWRTEEKTWESFRDMKEDHLRLDTTGQIVIIRKALYGLVSSSERWHSHFAERLRGLNFVPTRSDADVWIRIAAKTRKPTNISLYSR